MRKPSCQVAADKDVILHDGMTLSPDFARAILMALPAITYVYDVVTGKSVFQNKSFRDLLGYPPNDRTDSSWVELMHPDDKARFPAHKEHLRSLKQGQMISWEYRLHTPDGDWKWFQSQDVYLSESSGQKLIVGNAADVTRQKRAQEQHELLLGEMKHRSRNFGAVIRAIAVQSAPKSGEGAQAFDAFVSRLTALLDTGNLLLSSEDRRADLRAVVETALKPFLPDASKAILTGPGLTVPEKCAGSLSLIVHELATNATKYGSLMAGGCVELSWQEASEIIAFQWHENGGHRAVMAPKEGFGTRLLRALALPGSLVIEAGSRGLLCKFALASSQ